MSHNRRFPWHGSGSGASPAKDKQVHRRPSAGATSAMSPWGDDNGHQIQRQSPWGDDNPGHQIQRQSPWGDDNPGHQIQRQMQAQRLRSIQASEQMLYDVYEHTMGMIEELEKHEHAKYGKSAPNSGLLKHIIPRDVMQPEFEVNVKIETELTCLQAQMKFAPSEAKGKAVHEMLQKTILWLAARQEKEIPIGPVDYYARNVWQILNEEAITSPEEEKRPEIKLDEGSVNDVLYNYARARNQGEKQDKAFRDDPNKTAGIRKMRQGKDEQLGKDRLMELDKDQMR